MACHNFYDFIQHCYHFLMFIFTINVFDMKKRNVYLPSLMMKVPNNLYVLGDTYTCHTYCCYAYHFTHIGCTLFTCDMYICRLRLINDSVLSSLTMEGIRLLYLLYSAFFCFLTASMSVSAILVTRYYNNMRYSG
jgi:hypothetical protein